VKKLILILGLVNCLFLSLYAESNKPEFFGPQPLDPLPEFEADSSGNLLLFKYDLELKPFTHPNRINLEHYKGKNLLVFYFGATCGHCKSAIPHVLKVRNEFLKDSVEIVAIATGHNKPDDIGKFIKDYNVNTPVFKDEKRGFSTNYGTGGVPVIMVVTKTGHYVRFKGFTSNKTPHQMRLYFEKLFSNDAHAE
jgi:peroxiredoxin